jgi:hypothetical protein
LPVVVSQPKWVLQSASLAHVVLQLLSPQV